MEWRPSTERFRIKPIPIPEGDKVLAEHINTINVLCDLFEELQIPGSFHYRRGRPLEITVVGDGRPGEFVATQRFFGPSSSLEVIDKSPETIYVTSLYYNLLTDTVREKTNVPFKPATFTNRDVFGTDTTGNKVLKANRHVIVGLGLHPDIVTGGGIDLFADNTPPNGVIILTKRTLGSTEDLRTALEKRRQSTDDLEIISEGYIHLDPSTLKVTLEQTPDERSRVDLPVDFPDIYAIALRKKTLNAIAKQS